MRLFHTPQIFVTVLLITLLTGCYSNTAPEDNIDASPSPTTLPPIESDADILLNQLALKHQAYRLQYQCEENTRDTSYFLSYMTPRCQKAEPLDISHKQYTFYLEENLIGTNVVTEAYLSDITKKDANNYTLHLEAIGWDRSFFPFYYELEFDKDQTLALLSNDRPIYTIAATVSQIAQMKYLSISGTPYGEEHVEIEIESEPLVRHLIRGKGLEIIPTPDESTIGL